jgi:predicted secreted protein
MGRMLSVVAATGILLLAVALGPGAWAGEPRIGPEAQWAAPADAITVIHKECDALVGLAFGECFVSVMGKLGASPRALAFARRMENAAYLREFRDTGIVDVAYIFFPFRANENYGCLLVNGEPPIVNVDDLQELPQDDLSADSAYRALAARYRITIWPAERTGKHGPAVLHLPGGGQRFVVTYRLRDFCHACKVVGMAAFAFDFDAGGRFLGRRLIVVRAGEGGGEAETSPKIDGQTSLPPRVEVEAGKEFSIVLLSNHTTGYQWQVATPLDEQIVRRVGSEYVAPTVSRPGAGGKEVWTFRAVGLGRTEIALQHVRPWERGVAPVETAKYLVVVR